MPLLVWSGTCVGMSVVPVCVWSRGWRGIHNCVCAYARVSGLTAGRGGPMRVHSGSVLSCLRANLQEWDSQRLPWASLPSSPRPQRAFVSFTGDPGWEGRCGNSCRILGIQALWGGQGRCMENSDPQRGHSGGRWSGGRTL